MNRQQLLKIVDEELTDSSGRFNTRLARSPRYQHIHDAILTLTDLMDESYPFIARVSFIREGRTALPSCVCGAPTKYNKQNQSFNAFCSGKCAQSNPETRRKREQTCIAVYGVAVPSMAPEVAAKQKATNLERYGVEKPFQSKHIQQKVTNTVKAMGVTSTALLPTVAAKQKTTNLERYGVEKPFQSKHIQQKVTDSHVRNFGDIRWALSTLSPAARAVLSDSEALHQLHYVQQLPLTQIGEMLGVSDVTVGEYIRSHGMQTQYFFSSTGERELADYVQSLVPIIRNDRTVISPQELDIYVPSQSIAIEYCGLYWHGELQGKTRTYHRNKMRACDSAGVRLITVFEDEWLHNKDLTKSKIANILGHDTGSIGARKTKCVRISDSKVKREFFDGNHIQGDGPGSITYGLTHDGRLCSMMTFIRRLNATYELNRFASTERVVGGFQKLLTRFMRDHTWREIYSFADLRWASGNVYVKAGFTAESVIPPDYAYVVGSARVHKFNFRRHLLPQKLQRFDPALSEWENCKLNGVDRVWDCGKIRYVLRMNDH